MSAVKHITVEAVHLGKRLVVMPDGEVGDITELRDHDYEVTDDTSLARIAIAQLRASKSWLTIDLSQFDFSKKAS